MPPGLAQALGPVLEQTAEMMLKIKQYDHQIQQLGQTEYPETQALLTGQGSDVGLRPAPDGADLRQQGSLPVKSRCGLLPRRLRPSQSTSLQTN